MQKIRKHRGRKNCGGHKKKRRGAGHRGGRGRAGLVKRKYTSNAAHDAHVLELQKKLKPKTKTPVINLREIDNLAFKKNLTEIDVSDSKVLGIGEISKPLKITALYFSQKALEKIGAAGGKASSLAPVSEEVTTEEETSE